MHVARPPRVAPSGGLPVALAAVLALLATAPAPLAGQERDPFPSPAEVAAAEAAPLFASGEPLVATLETDVERLEGEREEERPAQPAVLTLHGDDGEVRIPLEVEPRGNFRRSKRNCSFPPIRLDLDRDDPELVGTVFEGENRLKLVLPCRPGRDSYQRYVFREYAIYRMMNALHDASFRVRLMELTFRDGAGRTDPFTVHAFLIEDDDRMAARNDAAKVELEQLHPQAPGGDYVTLVALFQYMIGNSDWDPTVLHNVELVRTRDLRYLTVPYDFDFSGAVDAPYASPNPDFPIDDVRERFYRGFCLEEVDVDALVARLVERREAMWANVRAIPLWDEDDREDFLEYVGRFWDIVGEEHTRRRRIDDACRSWG